MKKLFTILVAMLFISCTKNKSFVEPNDLGIAVFNIVKDYNKKTITEYQKETLTFEEIQEISNSGKISQLLKNEFKNITREEYEQIIFKDYNNTKSQGLEYRINWENIQYRDFIYEIQEDERGKGLIGYMYFENPDGRLLSIKCESFYDGDGFRIMRIFRIQEQN